MPELPEVETIVDGLNRSSLKDQTIKYLEIYCHSLLGKKSLDLSLIKNQTIKTIFRKGKQIIFSLTNNLYLIAHLKMTGHFFLTPKNFPKEKHEHIRFCLDNGYILSFYDVRKFGVNVQVVDKFVLKSESI